MIFESGLPAATQATHRLEVSHFPALFPSMGMFTSAMLRAITFAGKSRDGIHSSPALIDRGFPLSSGVAEAAGAAFGFGELGYFLNLGAHDWCDDQLGDAIAGFDFDGAVAEVHD